MKTKKKILVVLLRLSGLLLLTAIFAVFLPYEVMAEIHEWLGLGNFPRLPILDYLARSVSLFYATHGVILLYISFDLDRYLNFLKLFCYIGFAFGIVLFIVDINAPLPPTWTFSEGPLILVLSLTIFWLVKLVEKEIYLQAQQ